MSFDFFDGEAVGIKFTEQQQMFFKSRLPFLDPEQKKTIQLGQAVSLLKFAALPPGTQKKIFDNLKLTGKSSLDYTDMKKVLRSVALAQNRIEPSNININANIKTKMPQFYDDDSQEQQNNHDVKVQQKVQPPKQQYRAPVVQNTPKPAQQPVQAPSPSSSFNSPHFAQNRQNSKPKEAVQPKKNAETDKNLKKYEDFWSTLTTQDNIKISGNQVKKLFGNSQNRKQLAKIWKLCNNSYKGSLSKGELYVFVALMKSKSGSIPSQLTPQMKQTIAKIDGENTKAHKGTQQFLGVSNQGFDFDKSHNFDKTQPVSPKVTQKVEKKPSAPNNRMSMSSHDFDDFANFANPSPNARRATVSSQQYKEPVVHTQDHGPKQTVQKPVQRPTSQPPQLVQSTHPKLQPQQQQPQPQQQPVQVPQAPQVYQFPAQNLQLAHNAAYNQLMTLANTILPQIQMLSTQNKQCAVILEQTNQFLTNIDQAHLFFMQKINQLKVAQDDTNHRLNQTCIRMRDVIVKQSQLINSVIGDLQKQVEIGTQRVGVLEAYSQNIQSQVNTKVNQVNQLHMKGQNQRINNIPEHQNTQSNQYIPERTSRGSIKVGDIVISQDQPSYQYQQSQIYNKKSMESMRQMTQSMAIKKMPKKQNYQTIQIQTGGIYRQKLMEQLQQHQANIQSPKNNQPPMTGNQGGYHWNIAQRQDLDNKKPDPSTQRRNDTQQQDEDEQEKKQRQRQQAIFKQQEQEKARQEEYNRQQKQYMLQQQQQQAIRLAQAQAQAQGQAQQMFQAQQAQAQQGQQMQNVKPELSAEQRNLKMKQVMLIQMINYLTPISQNDYPIIVQRILSMTEAQIDATYAQYYKRYLLKIEQDQKNAEKKGETVQIKQMPNQDQFRTNNFKNQQPQAQNA